MRPEPRWVSGFVALSLLGAIAKAPLAAAEAAAQAALPVAPDSSAGAAPTHVSLQEAIDLALRREPRVNVALEEIRRAEALVKQARAGAYPTLTGNAAYTRLDGDRALGGRILSPENQLAANLNLTVPLLAASRWMQVSHASDNVAVARLSADDMRRQVAVAVAHAYLAVVAQHRTIEVSQRSLDNAKAHYEYAHTRFSGGIGTRVDDSRAAEAVASNEAQLENARAGLSRAQEALGVLLGADGPMEVSDEVALPDPTTLATGMADAVARRTDLRASAARSRAAATVVDDGWTDYLPLLSAQFQPFYQNPSTVTQPTTGWWAQLVLTVPLYDGGTRYGVAAERHALAAESQTQVEAALRQVKSEVRVAFEAVRRSDASLASAARAAKLSAETLELATMAYKAGATSELEVIDAERRARDAATAAVQAEDNARQARLDLLAATGHLP